MSRNTPHPGVRPGPSSMTSSSPSRSTFRDTPGHSSRVLVSDAKHSRSPAWEKNSGFTPMRSRARNSRCPSSSHTAKAKMPLNRFTQSAPHSA